MRCLLVIILLLSAGGVHAVTKDPVFDVQALAGTPLNASVTNTTEADGIITEEVKFHSETDGDKSVDIFAFFSCPKGAKKLPAYIWNQGGLARAEASVTELGAKRGYATMCIDFPLPGYRSTGGYPINAGLEVADDPQKSPIYHGVVALLKAVSYLQTRPEVDPDKIGMAGSSWGGFYTTLMIGIDPRLKVGSAMFGTGNLQLGNVWWDGPGWNNGRDATFRERWRRTLDPAMRLEHVKTPMAWFTGTNDVFYWLPDIMATYEQTHGPKSLSIIPNYNHALNGPVSEEVYRWLDTWLKGAPAFETLAPPQLKEKQDRSLITWSFTGPRKIVSADLIVSYGQPGNWRSRYWSTIPATITNGKCSIELQPTAYRRCAIGSVIDSDGFRYSTPMMWISAAETGKITDYNGCSDWGDFEEADILYMRLNGIAPPQTSQDAHTGKQSALLKPGNTTLPAMLFTAGLPHKFSCYMKANKEATVGAEIRGVFDGKAVADQDQFHIRTDWTEITLNFEAVSPWNLTGEIKPTIAVPEGVTVLVDSVELRPVVK